MDEMTVLLDQWNTASEWRQIVFWYEADGERDLTALADALAAKQVKLWILSSHNMFRTKYQIECVDPNSSYRPLLLCRMSARSFSRSLDD